MTRYRHISHGFEPVFDAQSRILVLGSFPSELSRRNDFYYGNPANRFWPVVAACAGETVPEDVEEKKRLLLTHGIALWDVICECDIKGSSDASIKNAVPARIERITDAASIQAVFCNGAVAARLYRKYLQYRTGIEAVRLPSTSPANAAWSAERLLDAWRQALGDLPRVQPGSDKADAHADVSYAVVSFSAPPASTFGVHRSMQGNKGKNTKPELLVRQRLRAAGLGGYRLHWKVPGRPDIAWPGKKVAVFVNGCYWHRCPHCNPSQPKRNTEYWTAKFARNVERDAESLAALRDAGWICHVVWECQLKKAAIDATMAQLLPQLADELGKSLRTPAE